MITLATKEEMTAYGGLGYRMDVDEMISQCKVIHDCVELEDFKNNRVSDLDVVRLTMIKVKLLDAINAFESIRTINEY